MKICCDGPAGQGSPILWTRIIFQIVQSRALRSRSVSRRMGISAREKESCFSSGPIREYIVVHSFAILLWYVISQEGYPRQIRPRANVSSSRDGVCKRASEQVGENHQVVRVVMSSISHNSETCASICLVCFRREFRNLQAVICSDRFAFVVLFSFASITACLMLVVIFPGLSQSQKDRPSRVLRRPLLLLKRPRFQPKLPLLFLLFLKTPQAGLDVDFRHSKPTILSRFQPDALFHLYFAVLLSLFRVGCRIHAVSIFASVEQWTSLS